MLRPSSFLVALTALALLQCAPDLAVPAPKLVFEAPIFDFGTVEQGMAVTHTFTFRNTGGSALTINNVKSGCDCIATVAAARTVPPGATGAIQATLDTSRMVRPERRSITVYSNDPAQPVVTLTLRGTVTIEVAADPPALYLGRVQRGQRGENEAHIVTRGAMALQLPPRESAVLYASLLDPTAGRAGTTLAVTIKPDAPLGRFAESILIMTSSSKHPTLTVPVVGIVAAEKE